MGIIAANTIASIFAPVPALRFSASTLADFQSYIENRSAGTEIVPVVDCEQLRMAVDGRLSESQYRFTVLGFNAVCNVVAPGLSNVFHELSGENPRKLSAADEFSIPTAVGIYNAAMQVRFPALMERGLLVSHTERTIDGCLGVEHKFLDNNIFYSMLYEETTAQQADAHFYRAEIVGRELSVYMLDSPTRCDDIGPDSRHIFASGWFFSNREDAGAALFATPCLFTRLGPAIMRQRGSKLSHVGADLTGRAAALMRRAVAQAVDMEKVRARVQLLLGKRLGYSANQKEQSAAIDKVARFLSRLGIRPNIGHVIAQNAAAVGADVEARDYSAAYDSRVLRARNFYDLFCSVLRYAKEQPTHMRLLLQAAAMEMVLPRPKKSG